MTKFSSSKKRNHSKYLDALDRVAETSEADADDIDGYVEWLKLQVTTKRKTIQVLNAELDELRRN